MILRTIALAMLLAPSAFAQGPRSRTLQAKESTTPGFDHLVKFAAAQLLGNRLPAIPDAIPLPPAVLIVVRIDGVAIWDVPVAPLVRGRFPQGALASCPGLCSVALRDAVGHALVEHQEALPPSDDPPAPTAIVLADAELPYGTLAIVARSAAMATRDAPPALGLVGRTAAGLGYVPIFSPPPQPVRLRPTAQPLLLEVEVEAGGSFVARTAAGFGAAPTAGRTVAALDQFLGHLKSRDPDKRVAFFSAPDATPLRQVAPALSVVRSHYPVLVVKARGPLPFSPSR